MVDLSTRYLGMELGGPLVASAGPLTGWFDALRLLEDAGAAAVVLPSLFEEQIVHEALDLHQLIEESSWFQPEASDYFPELEDYNTGSRSYLDYLEAAKEALSIPVIASLNGSSPGGWVRYARSLVEAGADAIELNVYYVAADAAVRGGSVEQRYLDLVREVRAAVSVPVAVKVGPYFSAFANMAVRLVEAGADGLVLFNRFLQPDIDLETLEVVPSLHLSTSVESGGPLRWIAILRGQVPSGTSLAATSGVHTWEDALKLILAGADVVMMTSALLQRGPGYLGDVLSGVEVWLAEHGYESVSQAKGSVSRLAVPDPAEFERSNYIQALVNFTTRFVG